MNDEINEMIIKAHKKSFERAFEVAVRTGTALIFSRDGKIVEIKPPFRYELVPIKSVVKKKPKKKNLKS